MIIIIIYNNLTVDLKRITEEGQALGLILNVSKSELISNDQSKWMSCSLPSKSYSFCGSQRCHLVGLSPIGSKSSRLRLVGEHLCHLGAHAITILCHSLAIPKFLHMLRTSPASSSPLLLSWDELLLSVIARITNIDLKLGDPSWLQASLPISSGGLGGLGMPHTLHPLLFGLF